MIVTNISLESFSIIVSFLLLLCCLAEKPGDGKQTKLLAAMLITNISVLFCDMMTWIFDGMVELTFVLYILNSLVYSLGYVMTALFTCFLLSFVRCSRRAANIINSTIMSLCVIAMVLVSVSYFNHMYFSCENATYVRGPLYWLSQAYPVAILVMDMIIILRYSKRIGLHDMLSLLSYGILPIAAMLVQIYVFGVTLLYIATTLSLLIIYITVHLEQSRRLQQQELELQQAKMAIMLSQIQPHFLFNSLSSIAELCTENPTAEKALINFSRYLRGNIDSLNQNVPLPFETELRHIEAYLYLEKLRFGDRLNILYSIKTMDFLVPSLTVQPIVENAVKYGVGMTEGLITVELQTYESANGYVIEIKDNGVGFDPGVVSNDGRTHIGLSNAQSRIKALCGGSLSVESIKGVGTTVVIRIPKEVKSQENNCG